MRWNVVRSTRKLRLTRLLQKSNILITFRNVAIIIHPRLFEPRVYFVKVQKVNLETPNHKAILLYQWSDISSHSFSVCYQYVYLGKYRAYWRVSVLLPFLSCHLPPVLTRVAISSERVPSPPFPLSLLLGQNVLPAFSLVTIY